MLLGLGLILSFSALVFTEEAEAAKNMYRLYNPNSGEHFYTATAEERDNLKKHGWKYEGIGWTAPESGADVYRLYNPNAGDHHYTTNVAEKNNLVKVGWKYEGIGWKSDTYKGIGLHRLYNPNAKAGSHHYTTATSERDHLKKVGWRYENIGWYGMNPNQQFNITVVHKGSDGKVLSQKINKVKRDNNYTAKSSTFNGYTLKGSSSQNVKADGNKTITFNYTKNVVPITKYNVTVVHKGSDKVLETEKVIQVAKNTNHTAKAKSFDGYKLNGKQTQTVKITKNTIITFNYDKVQPLVDKTELQKVYNELMNDIELNDYTKDSADSFKSKTYNIKSNVLDKKDVTQEEVNQAIKTLKNLKSEMVYIKELSLKVEELTKLVKEDYTESSWTDIQTVLSEATEVLNKSDATQSNIDNVIKKLNKVNSEKVSIKDLKTKIELLNTIGSEDYSAGSYASFTDSLSTAKSIVKEPGASQKDVDNALENLEKKHSELVHIKNLRNKVEDCKKIQNENFTESSWNSFKNSLESAILMLGNPDASQAEINFVLSELNYFHSKLEENPEDIADKKWLQELYDAIKDKDLSVYTDGTADELSSALENAKYYLETFDATQYEVNRAHDRLLSANLNLVNNSELKKVYNMVSNSIKDLDLSNYNDWQVKALEDALEVAKTILDDRTPTQRKVDDSKAALEDAFKNLEVARCVISIICKDENGNMVGRTDWSAEKGTYFDAEYLDIAFHGYVLDDEPVKRVSVTGNMEVDFKYKKATPEEIEMGSIRKKIKEDTISVWSNYRKEKGKSDISESQEIQSVANAKATEFGQNSNYEISNEFPSILDSYISREFIVKAENVTLDWIRNNGTEFIMNEWKKSPEDADSLLYQDESKKSAEGAIACNIIPSSDGKYNVFFVGLIGFTKYQTV